jgi:hypothetical protein
MGPWTLLLLLWCLCLLLLCCCRWEEESRWRCRLCILLLRLLLRIGLLGTCALMFVNAVAAGEFEGWDQCMQTLVDQLLAYPNRPNALVFEILVEGVKIGPLISVALIIGEG